MPRVYAITIIVIAFCFTECSAQPQQKNSSQKISDVDSLSIPFFPLHAGNVWVYALGSGGPQRPWDSTFSTTSRDTVVNAKQYVSLPATQESSDNWQFTESWFRSNGVDSVWKLCDTLGSECFFITFANLVANKMDSAHVWFGDTGMLYWSHVQEMDTNKSAFDSSITRKIVFSVDDGYGDRESFDFDERFGLYLYGYVDGLDPSFGTWNMVLKGGIINNKRFGTLAAVDENNFIARPNAATMKIFPNPAQTRAGLALQGIGESGAVAISISDVYGRIVRTAKIISSAGNASTEINFENLPAGFYEVRASVGKNILAGSVVITQ